MVRSWPICWTRASPRIRLTFPRSHLQTIRGTRCSWTRPGISRHAWLDERSLTSRWTTASRSCEWRLPSRRRSVPVVRSTSPERPVMTLDFSLEGRVAIVTGGAGLLGVRHGEAIAAAGGVPVLADIRGAEAEARAAEIATASGVPAFGMACDVTRPESIEGLLRAVLERVGRVDILVNNAANNPKVETPGQVFSRLERFPIEQWHADLAVGL